MRTRPFFGMTPTQAIRDLFTWHPPIMCHLLYMFFDLVGMDTAEHDYMFNPRGAEKLQGVIQ